jgi:hypothetical protein
MVVVFGKSAAPLYRKIAGRKVRVACWHLSAGGSRSDGGGLTLYAPQRGRTLHTGDLVKDWDYCSVWRPARNVRRGDSTTHYPRQLIVAIPLTQLGAVYLDEQFKAAALATLIALAQVDYREAWGPFRDTASIVGDGGGMLHTLWPRRARYPLVALARADQTPPVGALGYYGDGDRHAAAVALSALGRRLFIEIDRDEVLRTNVSKHLDDPLG